MARNPLWPRSPPHGDAAQLALEVIVDHGDALGGRVKEAGEGRDRRAGEVYHAAHPRGPQARPVGENDVRDLGIRFLMVTQAGRVALTELVDEHGADVVPCAGVIRPRV